MGEIMKDNKGFWDRWAKRYDFMMSKDGRTYAQIVTCMKRKLDREMYVLELACGTGLLSVQLAGNVKLLEATDFSEEMIRQAKVRPYRTVPASISQCRMRQAFHMRRKRLTQR